MILKRSIPIVVFRAMLLALLAVGQSAAAEGGDAPAENWKAPPFWMPPATESHGRRALAAGPVALPFIALPPCRLVDTRGNGAPLTGGFLPAATVRNYTLTGVCGVPANAQAISLNATAVKPTGPGFLVLYPEGGTFPPVSTLNYLGGDVIVNAAVVPLSGTGGIAVALGVSGGDVLLDTNGYYAIADVASLSGLVGDVTLAAGANVTITPSGNTLTIAATGGGAGTVSSVGTGAGLTGGPITTTGTVAVAPLGITTGMLADNAVTSAKIAPGAVGLAQIDPTQVQGRVSGGCPDGTMIQNVNQNGTVDCTASAPKIGFSTFTADGASDVGSFTSITIGKVGNALISYYDATNGDLKVASCWNAACTNTSSTALDSAGDVGLTSSITIGSDGLGLISYYDNTNFDLKVAHCSDAFCGSATLFTLDSAGDVGFHSSITIGTDGLGLISYLDATNGGLKVAHCSNVSCSTATRFTLDSGGVGNHSSITIGSDGLGLISYYDGTNGDLKVAHCSNVTCTAATVTTLDNAPADVGAFNSITIGSDGFGLISYYDATNGDLKVAHCFNVSCTSATLTTLDSPGDVGRFGTSITIGPDGLGLISYLDFTNFVLKVAHCSNASCTAAALTVVDNSLPVHVGRYSSITIGPDGFALISYYDFTNGHLKAAHCSNALCTPFVRRR